MTSLWTHPSPPGRLVVVEKRIAITSGHSVIGIDENGGEVWRETFRRVPDHLVMCGHGVAFDLSDRTGPTQIVALDLAGAERWRYDRRWGLLFEGLAGDARGIVVNGQDTGTSSGRWVGLDTAGTVTFDVAEPGQIPRIAGDWLLGLVRDGEQGIARTDRAGRHPTPLTSIGVSAWAASDELLLVNTMDEPFEMIAIELANGRERWRAPGGTNLEIGIDGGRAAWVTGDRRPVVHELASGARSWAGDPMPAIGDSDSYSCKLGPSALVCYGGFRQVSYYSLAATAPLAVRPWAAGDAPAASRFWRGRFLEASADGLTCRELA